MPALELFVEPAGRGGYLALAANPTGLARIPFRRLMCQMRVPTVPGAWPAVLDTGAPLTVFPLKIWSHKLGWRSGRDYDELPLAGGGSVVRHHIGGQVVGCRLVRLRVPVELAGRPPGPRHRIDDLIAFLAEVGGPSQVLLGLGGDALAGTSLHISRVPNSDDLAARLEF